MAWGTVGIMGGIGNTISLCVPWLVIGVLECPQKRLSLLEGVLHRKILHQLLEQLSCKHARDSKLALAQSMVGDAVVRKVVRADALRARACARHVGA